MSTVCLPIVTPSQRVRPTVAVEVDEALQELTAATGQTIVVLVNASERYRQQVATDLIGQGCTPVLHDLDEATIGGLPTNLRDLYTILRRRLGNDAQATAIVVDQARFDPETAAQYLTFGRLTIDRLRFEARVDRQNIRLTKGEFDVLFYLACHAGIAKSRREIVEHCHGILYPVTDRSVDVQVLTIRRKLGPAKEYLQTVRGVGYQFAS